MGKKPENRPTARINDEDRELFRQAIEGTRRIRTDKMEPHRNPPRPRVTVSSMDDEQLFDGLSDDMEQAEVQRGDELLFVRSGIQHGVVKKLRRGQYPIEDELDLHGLRSDEARTALAHFLNFAQQRHLRCVRIIHGKGYGSQSRQPVLKNKVNSWLRQRDDVLAFCSARPADGGTGAVAILLKRQ